MPKCREHHRGVVRLWGFLFGGLLGFFSHFLFQELTAASKFCSKVFLLGAWTKEHADSCRSCGKCWLSHSGAVSLQHHQEFWPGLLQSSSSRVQKIMCVCIPTWQTAMNFTTKMLISFFQQDWLKLWVELNLRRQCWAVQVFLLAGQWKQYICFSWQQSSAEHLLIHLPKKIGCAESKWFV